MNKETEKELNNIIAELRADREKRLKVLKETIANHNPEAMFAEGFDDCLAGFDSKGRAIYFANEIIGTLVSRDDMSEEEALEFFDFNIECAYVGEFTPIYMWEE
jgi:hypothetical protein